MELGWTGLGWVCEWSGGWSGVGFGGWRVKGERWEVSV